MELEVAGTELNETVDKEIGVGAVEKEMGLDGVTSRCCKFIWELATVKLRIIKKQFSY